MKIISLYCNKIPGLNSAIMIPETHTQGIMTFNFQIPQIVWLRQIIYRTVYVLETPKNRCTIFC